MKYRFSLLLIGILLLNTIQCAKRATPTGGPRDSLPPIMVNASPKMNTTFFDKEEITTIAEVQGQILSKGTISIVGLPDEYK